MRYKYSLSKGINILHVGELIAHYKWGVLLTVGINDDFAGLKARLL